MLVTATAVAEADATGSDRDATCRMFTLLPFQSSCHEPDDICSGVLGSGGGPLASVKQLEQHCDTVVFSTTWPLGAEVTPPTMARRDADNTATLAAAKARGNATEGNKEVV